MAGVPFNQQSIWKHRRLGVHLEWAYEPGPSALWSRASGLLSFQEVLELDSWVVRACSVRAGVQQWGRRSLQLSEGLTVEGFFSQQARLSVSVSGSTCLSTPRFPRVPFYELLMGFTGCLSIGGLGGAVTGAVGGNVCVHGFFCVFSGVTLKAGVLQAR